MAYADIIATAVDFGSEIGRLTDALPDIDGEPATVPEIFLTAARHALKLDLGDAWGLNLEEATAQATLDDRADTVPTNIRRALATLQIAMFYESVAGAEDDLASRLGRIYRSRYTDLVKGAGTWGQSFGSAHVGTARILI